MFQCLPGANVIKLFGRNLRIFVIRQSVFPDKPLQPSLMFEGEARSLPYSSLLRKSVNYGQKSLIILAPERIKLVRLLIHYSLLARPSTAARAVPGQFLRLACKY